MKRTYVIQVEGDNHAEVNDRFGNIAKAIIIDGAAAGQLLDRQTMAQQGIFSCVTHNNEEGIRVEAMLALTALVGPLLDAMKHADLRMNDDDKPKDSTKPTPGDELAAMKILAEALAKAKGV